jgi:hypothetical protein
VDYPESTSNPQQQSQCMVDHLRINWWSTMP